MDPERKQQLLLPDELVRMRRETDEILAESARSLKEMQLLIDESERLQQRQIELLAIRQAAKRPA
jgi:replicative DNA helicase